MPQESKYCSVKLRYPDAVLGQGLEVSEGFVDALPAESVERPEQHKFEYMTGRRSEQRFELITVAILAAGDIDEFPLDFPSLRAGEGPKLVELVLVVLLVGRCAAVKGDVHTCNIQSSPAP
jgi:hypothetical protein